jgi:hypothetical protein
MLRFPDNNPARIRHGLSRRDFVRTAAAGVGAVGLTLADFPQLGAASETAERSCILLFLVGGPSHIDTFDPKPNAPENIRGPFRPICTNVPGIHLCEHLPRMAKRANRFALVRSVHHTAAPIHETGHQLMQTGKLSCNEQQFPHCGSVLARVRDPKQSGIPPFVILPGPIGSTGVDVSHGQTAGALGAEFEPVFLSQFGVSRLPFRTKRALNLSAESEVVRSRYGANTFGQSVLTARRLVAAGVRFVTVNMFDTVFNKITWDCHADGSSLATTLNDYAGTLCPMFDQAYSALLDDLHDRGMLSNTLVLAMGEFGRTPKINPRGGRDHWTGAWSVMLAGAGIRGGQVVGSSDAIGAEVRDRPVTPAEIAATVYQALGVHPETRLPGPNGMSIPVCDANPVWELF